MRLYPLIRPFAFALDPERAHRATIAAVRRSPKRMPPVYPDSLRSTVAGLDFPSPVGLAAGFDKDAEVPERMLGLGFGFVEVGTVTPRPQQGNPKPRMFRLPSALALINRLGFNNDGIANFVARASATRAFSASGGVLGLNIGKNADTQLERALDDYLT